MLKDVNHYQHELAKRFKSFNEYIRWRCSEEVRFQKDFVYGENDQLLVNYIGKFENIDDDFKTITSHIGINVDLPHKNSSKHTSYRDYYTDDTRDLVEGTFKVDYETFGY